VGRDDEPGVEARHLPPRLRRVGYIVRQRADADRATDEEPVIIRPNPNEQRLPQRGRDGPSEPDLVPGGCCLTDRRAHRRAHRRADLNTGAHRAPDAAADGGSDAGSDAGPDARCLGPQRRLGNPQHDRDGAG
jgi:hypothetical protein